MYHTITLSTALLLLLILLSSFGGDSYAIVCTYMGEQHNNGDRWVSDILNFKFQINK